MNNGLFEPNIVPDGTNNSGNNTNVNNSGVNPDELRSLNQQMNNNMPNNDMNNQVNQSNMNNMPNNGMNYNNMNNQFNQSNMNNMPNNGMSYNNMNNQFNQNNMNNNMPNNMNNQNGNNSVGMPNNNYNPMGNTNMNDQAPMPNGSGNKTALMVIGILIVISLGVGAYYMYGKDNQKSGGGNTVNKQVLFCTKESSEDIKLEAELIFNNNRFVTGKFKEIIDLSTYSDEQVALIKNMDLCSDIVSESNELYSFSNCKQSVSGNTLTINTDYDISSTLMNKEVDLEDGKKIFEEQGLACEIR